MSDQVFHMHESSETCDSVRPLLTVILAAKDVRPELFNAAVWSFAALRNSNSISLIVVSSGVFPGIPKDCVKSFQEIRVVSVPPEGVYSAYNSGLSERLGEYVLFFGADDLALPGLDCVIDAIKSFDSSPDLVACCAYMQGVGISCPSPVRGSVIFRNWCQQGLIYNSRIFSNRRFDCRYKVQADHKLNLELLAQKNLRVSFRKDVVSHFAAGGITSSYTDWVFREDMPGMVLASYGRFFWLLALIKRKLADLIRGAPEKRKRERDSTIKDKYAQ